MSLCEYCRQSFSSLHRLEKHQQSCRHKLITIHSHKCDDGHVIFDRLSGDGPYLKDRYPNIFKQIHPTLNQGIDLDKITYGSGMILWWKCEFAKCTHHEWQATVCSRTSKNNPRGCPYCANRKICPCNSFSTLYPELIEEFDFERNVCIDPHTLAPKSGTYCWWICRRTKCGHHRWEAQVSSRASGAECPYCDGKKACPCYCLSSEHPHLVAEFDTEKNGNITPHEIPPYTNKKYWWKCLKAKCDHHRWEVSVGNRINIRTRITTGCPYCSGNRTCPCDSFASVFPDLLAEFDTDRNVNVDPYTISSHSNEELWWKCLKAKCDHHHWKSSVNNRTKRGCPYCVHQKICPCDSLATQFPDLMREFDYEKNAGMDPLTLAPFSSTTRAWWKCLENPDHSWNTCIMSRTRLKSGCPDCIMSKLERECSRVLAETGLKVKPQKRFDDCRNIRTLPFDYYVEEFNLCIEIDGQQHFEVVYFNGRTPTDLAHIRYLDNIKNEYCRNKRINLLRISYSEIDNVGEHIRQAIEYIRSAGNHLIKFVGCEYGV